MTDKGTFCFCASEGQAEKMHLRVFEDSVWSQKQFPREQKAMTEKDPFCFCASERTGTEDIRVRV
jgi:hypothetical protein